MSEFTERLSSDAGRDERCCSGCAAAAAACVSSLYVISLALSFHAFFLVRVNVRAVHLFPFFLFSLCKPKSKH